MLQHSLSRLLNFVFSDFSSLRLFWVFMLDWIMTSVKPMVVKLVQFESCKGKTVKPPKSTSVTPFAEQPEMSLDLKIN